MIKWGVLGLGKMANQFATAIKETDNAELIGAASLSEERLNSFSKKYQIKNNYKFNNYEDILKSNDIDAVYISALNNSHLNLILKSAENGKNILCEKPMAMTYDEAIIASNLIKKNKIFFMEAIAYRSHQQTNNVIKVVNDGEIGKIKSINSSFGFRVKKINPESRLFKKSFGGGAILDIGCYPLSFISLFDTIKGDIIIENAKGDFCETGVDDYAEANLLLNNKIKAHIKISFKNNLDNNSIIYGENGHVIIPSPWLPEKKSFIEVNKKNSSYKIILNSERSIYAQQIYNFSNFIINNSHEIKSPNLSLDESLKIPKLLSEWSKRVNLT